MSTSIAWWTSVGTVPLDCIGALGAHWRNEHASDHRRVQLHPRRPGALCRHRLADRPQRISVPARFPCVSPAGVGSRDAIPLVVFLGVSFAAAAIGSFVTTASLDPWYATLRKPEWTPSGAVIGAIWTVLYALMGVAAWLVWRVTGWTLSLPLMLFAVQLVLNVLWSVLFFGLQNLAAGLVGILVLWVAVAATLVVFWRVIRWAGALFVPYLTWVTIATALNVTLWQMNS